MKNVWIDGRLVAARDATVPAVTPGVQVGYGVFEALSVVQGHAFALTRHLGRLHRSAAIVGLEVPFGDERLREAVAAVIEAGSRPNKVRITVSAQEPGADATVVVNALSQVEWAAHAHAVLSPYVRNERSPTSGAKTTSYIDNVLALAQARRAGADEALLCDTNGHLSEGTSSNVFLECDGLLCTPSLANGGLGGMTRELLCEVVPVTERDDLGVADLRRATEVFVTSSTRGVHPVATIDGVEVPECPGPLTSEAADAYAALQARTLDP